MVLNACKETGGNVKPALGESWFDRLSRFLFCQRGWYVMVTSASKIRGRMKPHIVVCSAGGLQAGDLAALLVNDFEVERVMTLPGLVKALDGSVQALILFMEASSFCQDSFPVIIDHLKEQEIRVLVFGAEGKPQGRNEAQIRYFAEIPSCQVVLEALSGLVKLQDKAFEAHG